MIEMFRVGDSIVMRCMCGTEEPAQMRPASLVRAAVIRMMDHTNRCEQARRPVE